MIFKPILVRRIAERRKTMTRRRMKPGETHCRYREGRTYAVQPGRGRRAAFRIRVLRVEPERLGDITFDDARAEGFRTRQEFFDYWTELYDGIDHDEVVWAIRFETVESVWLLHRDSSHGYTANPHLALADEPEAVDPETVATLGRHAKRNERQHVSKHWLSLRMDIETRIRAIESQHILSAGDVKYLRGLRHQLDAGDRRFGRAA